MVNGKVQPKVQATKKGSSAQTKSNGGIPVASSPLFAANGKSSAKVKTVASLASCTGCGIYITEDTKALQRDRCQGTDAWKCVDCLHLSTEIYDQLLSDENCSLRWFCESCDRSTMDRNQKCDTRKDDRVDSLIALVERLMVKFETMGAKYQEDANSRLDTIATSIDKIAEKVGTIEKSLECKADISAVAQLDTRVEYLESRLTNAESQIAAYSDVKKAEENVIKKYVEKAVAVQTSQDTEELEEKEKRRTSLIIHGIRESASEESEEREEDDLDVVALVLQELKCDDAAVKKVIRLGKRPESAGDDTVKPRPIKMVVESVEQKVKIIRSAKNLRLAQEGDWKTVFIHQDLTMKEREQRRKLVQELKDRKEKGETDLILVGDKIVKRITREY